VSGNQFEIVVTLPKANGVAYKDDRHLADTIRRRIEEALRDRVQWNSSAEVEVRRVEE
jgi:hypothetical protein